MLKKQIKNKSKRFVVVDPPFTERYWEIDRLWKMDWNGIEMKFCKFEFLDDPYTLDELEDLDEHQLNLLIQLDVP
jgi:hypothetical protein